MAFLGSAAAHDWYPPTCCKGDDCRRIQAKADWDGHWHVFIREVGWYDVQESAIRRLPVPPDGQCHACYRIADYTTIDGKPLVFFYCFFPCGPGS